MKIPLQRKLDSGLGKPICRVLSLLCGRENPSTEKPEKILVILLSEMGSLVLTAPMFRYIREHFPGASIYALVFKRNREVLELLNFGIEEIFTIDDSSFGRFTYDSARALLEIRKEKMDAVIDCELFSRISSIFSCLSGAALRSGFHPHTQEGLYRGDFINRPVLYNPYNHISRQFVALAEALRSRTMPLVKSSSEIEPAELPPLYISEPELKTLQQRLTGDFPQVTGKRLVLLYPGGGLLPIRAWPLENFARVARELIGKGFAVATTGLKEDGDIARSIQSACSSADCIDLTGYTRTVRELICLFHIGSLLITNDGGPGHFAALTPIPSIIFYGPETPVLYGPLDHKTCIFYKATACSPCLTAYNHRNSPCDGDNKCLKQISTEEVLAKASEILKTGAGYSIRAVATV